MIFIIITIFLDVLGLGIIIPVLPHLVADFLGGDASHAAYHYGFIASAYATMQFIFAPILGKLSDRYGRRPVILIALFGFGINYLILGWAPSLVWLYIARIFSGITGASFSTANAYIADVSDSTNRAQNFGMLGAVFGLGFIFGPALGGFLGHLGPRIPFFVSAALVFLNLIYGYFVLPESLPKDERRPFSYKDINPFGGLSILKKYPTVAGLAIPFVCLTIAQRSMESIWVLYTQYRFNWSEIENGLGLSLNGIMTFLVMGVVIRKVVPRFGERKSVLIGVPIIIVGYFLYGLCSQGWMMLTVVVFASFGSISVPSLQSIAASSVPPSEQGTVQGTMTSLMSLTAIIAPIISSQSFAFFTQEKAPFLLPGAPFFISVIFLVTALVLILRLFSHLPATFDPKESHRGVKS